MRGSSFLAICAAFTVASCGSDAETGSARVEGRVTDAQGAQTRSFGGMGTTTATTAVRASAVLSGGALELLGEAEIESNASYSLELPAEQRGVILQAVDASGEVLAAAILESSGAEGETVFATPIDSESSLEAAVYLEMLAQGASHANTVDLRARITSELALAVRIAHDNGEDVSDIVATLATGVRAAQEAEIAMYARAGVNTTQADLLAAELAASTQLSFALHGGASPAAAYDTFFEALVTAATHLGVDAEQQGRAEAVASASFRASIEARIAADTHAMIREAALLAAASLEARAQEQATLQVLAAGNAASDVQASALTAAAELRGSIGTAVTLAAAADAYARFGGELRGESQVMGSVLGDYLALDLVTAVSAEIAVDASATAAANLDAAIDAAITASLGAGGAIDARALANAIVSAYGAYFDAVAAQAVTFEALSDDVHARTAVGVLLVADGSFGG